MEDAIAGSALPGPKRWDPMEGQLDEARAQVLARAAQVSVTLAEHAQQTEELGTPSPAAVAALKDAGLLSLTLPREHGGLQADLGTQARVAMELGQGCASVAWVAALSNSAKASIGPMLRAQARSAVFADPDAVLSASGVGGGRARRVEEGLRVSGRWAMASGCELATWASLLVSVTDEQGQVVEAGLALAPVADLTIDRSWRSVGLQGTGSYTLVAEDLLITDAFTLVGPVGGAPAPPPARVSLGAVLAHLAPMVGAAHGQVQAAAGLFTGDRVPSRTAYSRLVDSPMARHWFSRAERASRTAVTNTLLVADGLDRLRPGQEPPPEVRAGWRMDLVAAAQAGRSALEDLLDLRGAGGFAPSEPLQRTWRDVAVGTRYTGLNPYIADEDHGRALLQAGPPVSYL